MKKISGSFINGDDGTQVMSRGDGGGGCISKEGWRDSLISTDNI